MAFDTKRNIDWDEREESVQEDTTTSDVESNSEEPRIKDVFNNLSKAVSELLHNMATGIKKKRKSPTMGPMKET